MRLEADDRVDRQVWAAIMRERTRLADDLHDGVLQDLAAMRRACADALDGDERGLQALEQGLLRMSTELRAVTGALHEETLDELALREAIERIVEPLRTRDAFEIVVDVTPAAEAYNDPLVREGVRELVLNASQHADAGAVVVSVAVRDGDLQLRVTDDGVGIDPARADEARTAGHLGLPRLERTAAGLGGTFEARPGDAGGTVASLVVPVSALERRVGSAPA